MSIVTLITKAKLNPILCLGGARRHATHGDVKQRFSQPSPGKPNHIFEAELKFGLGVRYVFFVQGLACHESFGRHESLLRHESLVHSAHSGQQAKRQRGK